MNEDKLKKLLGLNIKQNRQKLKLTQDVFSERIGITQRQLSLIELGKSFPRAKTLSNIANISNCQIQDLFNFDYAENKKELEKEFKKILHRLPYEKLKTLFIVGKNL